MLVTSHVCAGAAMGALLPRVPVAALGLGIASHLAMDTVPHWGLPAGVDILPVARRDGMTGLVAMATLCALAPPERRLAALAGMVGGALPDLDKPGRHFVGRSPWPARFDGFHSRIQREAAHRMPQELATGLALAVLAAGLLRR